MNADDVRILREMGASEEQIAVIVADMEREASEERARREREDVESQERAARWEEIEERQKERQRAWALKVAAGQSAGVCTEELAARRTGVTLVRRMVRERAVDAGLYAYWKRGLARMGATNEDEAALLREVIAYMDERAKLAGVAR